MRVDIPMAHALGIYPCKTVHAPTGYEIESVIWVDTTANQYCQTMNPPTIGEDGEVATRIIQCKRIDICIDKRLILIDQFEGKTPGGNEKMEIPFLLETAPNPLFYR